MFPDGANEGLYHTADATLWFFHALDRYLERDRTTASRSKRSCRSCRTSSTATSQGTRFGIKVDERDGLLAQGEEDYQLTWMDAKCDGWVVTPRRGKAVEINALWYNALRLARRLDARAARRRGARRRSRSTPTARARSFNERFWYEEGGHLFDVVESRDEGANDPACRPNQLLAVSLEHAVLERERWESVVEVVREKLLTPVGLRSLAPDHPDFKPTYHGDLKTRDAAYHQGTVWALAHRPVRGRVAQSPPGRPRGRTQLARGLHPTSGRGVCRLHQRSLRRRRAVPRARLHRAGVERRGSFKVLGFDFRVNQVRTTRGSGWT